MVVAVSWISRMRQKRMAIHRKINLCDGKSLERAFGEVGVECVPGLREEDTHDFSAI